MGIGIFCGAGLCAFLLSAVPANAAPRLLAPGARTMDQFVLAPVQQGSAALRSRIATLAAVTKMGPEPRKAAQAAMPLTMLPNFADFLEIRQDLRVLVNAAVQDARRERITLGVHFARTF